MNGKPSPREWDREIVEQFRVAMKLGGRTIRTVSNNTGIPYRSLQNYLSGTSKMPAAVLMALCEELGIDSNFLAFGSFHLAHSTLAEALFAALGDAAFAARPTNTPLRMAKLSEQQQRAVDELTQRVNAYYDRATRSWIGQLGSEVEEAK